MSREEVSQFLEAIEKHRKEIAGNKKESAKFLQRIGILTKKGTVRKKYQDICIPIDQA